ncbi:MAG TPA: hypothetical protein VLD39_02060, partial [Gammaproteobacteria bacterium]|nr:hypothetical protein [Gammaproteobacteria bacterium]
MVSAVELISQYAWAFVILASVLAIALVAAWRARAAASSATSQLVDELRALESATPETRLPVNGRPAGLAQVVVSVNRLLDRSPASAVAADPLFETL